jgi:hypothetical protein
MAVACLFVHCLLVSGSARSTCLGHSSCIYEGVGWVQLVHAAKGLHSLLQASLFAQAPAPVEPGVLGCRVNNCRLALMELMELVDGGEAVPGDGDLQQKTCKAE